VLTRTLDFGRFRTNSVRHSHLPDPRPALSPPPLHRGLLPSRTSLVRGHANSSRPYVPCTSTPHPSTKDTERNLNGVCAENRHVIFVAGLSALDTRRFFATITQSRCPLPLNRPFSSYQQVKEESAPFENRFIILHGVYESDVDGSGWDSPACTCNNRSHSNCRAVGYSLEAGEARRRADAGGRGRCDR
jgi:hypothetical protein